MSGHGEHDAFHPVTSDDAAWIETLWFPFWIPERDMTVYPRVVFQPNGGSYGGSVAVWSGANQLHFEGPLAGRFERLEDLGDLRDLRLPGGLSVQCLAPGSRYRLAYEHIDCAFDLEFDALAEPDYPAPEDSPGMFAGHLDQHGRVTGLFRLGQEKFAVDCGSVRDRSWGPRVVRSDLRLGNAHATGQRDAFFAYIQEDEQGRDAIHGGSLLRGGQHAALVSGVRTTEWEDGWPAGVHIQAIDTLGRSLEVHGSCRNRRAVVANPELYAVLNLVEWRDGETPLWGENHDVWSRSAWLSAGRDPLESGD
jgi:hypothetical protein